MSTSNVVNPSEIFLPLEDSWFILIPITIMLIIIFITGLLQNTVICIVLRLYKNMHTANVYLLSVSIADILIIISGIPQEIYSNWIKEPYNFGQVFYVLRGLVEETSANASILTITLFSLKRYFAILKPFLAHRMSTLSQARRNVIIVWAVSLSLAVLKAFQLRIVNYGAELMYLETKIPIQYALEIFTITITYFLPALVITVCYSLIGLRLFKINANQNSVGSNELRRHILKPLSIHDNKSNAQSTKKDVKMLSLVVAFFICWTPYHAQRLIAMYGSPDNYLAKSPFLQSVYTFIRNTSAVFYYMSTCINPIVYHIMSNKFRDAFKATILERFWPNTGQPVAQQCCSIVVPMSRNANLGRSANSGKSKKENKIIEDF